MRARVGWRGVAKVRDLSLRAAETAKKIGEVVGGNDAQVRTLSDSLRRLVG